MPAAAVSDDKHALLMLPADIMHKILESFSARHLCRLRTVCRSWRTFFSDPAFIEDHDTHQKPLVVVGVTGGHQIKTLKFVILDLCTGNIVKRVPTCCSWGEDWSKVHVHHHIAVIAVDKRCLRLHRVDLESGAVSVVPNNLQVEHLQDSRSKASCATLVVGRASTGEHKALRVRGFMCSQFCHVLDLDGDGRHQQQWRETQAPNVPIMGNGTVVKGVAYFLVYPSSSLLLPVSGRRGFHGPDGIASFDLGTEQWSRTLIHGPLSISNDDETYNFTSSDMLQLSALNGCLVSHAPYHCDVMDLWFYEGRCPEDGRALWCWAYSIEREGINRMVPLWVLDKDGGLVMWDISGVLWMYDPTNNEFADGGTTDSCVSAGVYTGRLLYRY
ncbi:hypothetical protein QOZ80_7BG0590920 [Eleusine coracana subsp. coracana]|nr:hypothetical protein QOZ80_7BG0590920 [Eleusine coracana subsp. coracana]